MIDGPPRPEVRPLAKREPWLQPQAQVDGRRGRAHAGPRQERPAPVKLPITTAISRRLVLRSRRPAAQLQT